MKKISLIVTLLFAVLLLQNCKKDTATGSATSTQLLFADINDSTWNAATVTAGITYNSATKTKVFTCTGIEDTRELNLMATLNTNSNTPGFPLATYNANTSGNAFSYYISTNGTFAPQGTVAAGSGSVIITAIDSTQKVITGTFSFTSLKNNYDSNGNITSVNIAEISSGAFNKMPYTFKSN